jgi:hypothetical protein
VETHAPTISVGMTSVDARLMTNPSEQDEYEEPRQKGMVNFRHATMEEEIADASTSIRRWWWEYLRLSKDYWLLCQTTKGGVPDTYDERMAQIYRDFGNIYDCSFEEWWRRTGSELFREQRLPPRVQQITSVESAISGDRAGKILVEIPLQLSKETVQKQINMILELFQDRRPSNRLETSTSRYPINVTLARLNVLQKSHEVFCLHRELIAKPTALAQSNMTRLDLEFQERANLFKIGKALGISPSNERLTGTKEEIDRRANSMRQMVWVHMKRAKVLIANVEHGVFPDDQMLDETPARFSSKQEAEHGELEALWWTLDLSSSLSEKRLEKARRIHYEGN